jgi:sterol-4alpha-carboxylate 3-dehydrogenase (decarboxylating)
MWRLAEAYRKGQHKYQMGNNTNLVDYCYVGNVADAHILAADRLAALATSPSSTVDDVSGQVFFITDGKLGHDGRDIVVLPKLLCLLLAFFSELWASIFGGPAGFPRFIVIIATQEQWYNIDKVCCSHKRLSSSP